PVRLEANRNRDGDEADGNRDMQQPQALAGPRLTVCRANLAAQKGVNASQPNRHPRAAFVQQVLDHDRGLDEVDRRIQKRKNVGDRPKWLGFRFSRQTCNQRSNRKDSKEESGESERQGKMAADVKSLVPLDVLEQR